LETKLPWKAIPRQLWCPKNSRISPIKGIKNYLAWIPLAKKTPPWLFKKCHQQKKQMLKGLGSLNEI